jgi:hypothetical protein
LFCCHRRRADQPTQWWRWLQFYRNAAPTALVRPYQGKPWFNRNVAALAQTASTRCFEHKINHYHCNQHEENPQIPNHSPLKIGILSNILSDKAEHFQLSKTDLLDKLF